MSVEPITSEPMTRAEHYREAQRLYAVHEGKNWSGYAPESKDRLLAEAQFHATMASVSAEVAGEKP